MSSVDCDFGGRRSAGNVGVAYRGLLEFADHNAFGTQRRQWYHGEGGLVLPRAQQLDHLLPGQGLQCGAAYVGHNVSREEWIVIHCFYVGMLKK